MSSLSTSKFVILTIILTLLISAAPATMASGFPDTRGHWAAQEIDNMVRKGAVTGYPDGKFYPSQNVTRRELAKIIFSLMPSAGSINTGNISSFPDYPDVHSGWGQQHLETSRLFLPGYTDGQYKPDAPATRYEVALLSLVASLIEQDKYQLDNRRLLLELPLPDSTAWQEMIKFKEFAPLPDRYRSSNAYLPDDPNKENFFAYAGYFFSDLNTAALLVGKNILRGYSDNTLGLDKAVTRAETVVIVSRILNANLEEAEKYLLEPAGKVYRTRTVNVTAGNVEQRIDQIGSYYREKYNDPLERAQKIYNFMIHTFGYDWETREGLKTSTATDVAGLMKYGRATDTGLAGFYAALADKAELQAKIIQGTAVNNGDTGNHTWVELTINGKTVSVDPTYGVCTGDIYFNNFDHWHNQGYQWNK